MRKDSQIFLKRILDYRNSTGKNNFELNYKYFDDIPSVETAIYDILDDLVSNNCLTSKSQVIDLEGNISINLTLDGITYFDDEKEKNSISHRGIAVKKLIEFLKENYNERTALYYSGK